MEQKTYKSIDLVEKIFQFIELNPSKENLISIIESLDDAKNLLLKKQIKSLMEAYSIHDPKKDFISCLFSGDFIQKRNISDYTLINDLIKKTLSDIDVQDLNSISDLVFIYKRIIEYKIKLRELLKFNNDFVMASSDAALFTIEITEKNLYTLKKQNAEIDTVLELIINPSKLVYSKNELMTHFNYPEEEIEMNDF